MLTLVLAFTIAVVFSCLCSLAEAVFLSLGPMRLESLRRSGARHMNLWPKLKQNVHRPIAAILILNTVAHTGGATVAGAAFRGEFGEQWLWMFSLFFTLVILFGTEIAPKVLGVVYNKSLAPWIGLGLTWLVRLLAPVIWLAEVTMRGFRKRPDAEADSGVSVADLETIARLARNRRLIDVAQEQIIVRAARLRDLRAQDAMVPFEKVQCVRLDRALDENLTLARQTLHTRYVATRDGAPDSVCGYVNFKDIFAVEPDARPSSLDQFVREVLFVSGQTPLNDVLKRLVSKRQHLAVVRDPNEKVIGMLTLEDVLEEIVGEMEDEFD